MKNNNINIKDKDSTQKTGKNAAQKILKVFAIVLGCLLGFIVIAAAGVTLWLSPERIAGIINEEAGKYVNAEVHVSSVSYHIWRTFPFLEVELDSISIKSHSLNNLPDSLKSLLPLNNDMLMSCSKIKGSINIPKLIKKEIDLGQIEIKDLQLNAVQINDSLSNFNLLSREEIEKLKEFKIHDLELKGFSMTGKNQIRYDNIAKDLKLTLIPEKIEMQRNDGDAYVLSTSLKASFANNKSSVFKDLPISLNGHVLMPSNLKAIGLRDFRVAMKDIDCELNLQAYLNKGVIIKSFDYKLIPLDIMGLIAYIPHEYLKGLDTTGIDGILTLGSEGKLTEPFSPTEDRIPSFQGRVDVTGKDIRVPVKGELISLNGLAGIIGFDINGKDITRSFVDIKRLSMAGEGFTANASAKAERILSEHPFVNAELDLQGRLENISRHLPQLGKYALRGESDSKVKLSFGVRNIKELAIGDMLCDAEVSLKRFAVQPDSRTTAGVGNIKASFHGRIHRISSKGISGITMKGNIKTDDVALNARGMSLKTNSLNLLGNYSADKGALRLEVDSLLLNNGVSMSTELTGTTASGNLKGDKISFDLKTDSLLLNSSSTCLSINDIALAGSVSKPGRVGNRGKRTKSGVKESGDEEALKTVSHTPDRIRIFLDSKTKEIINNHSARVNAKIGSGLLTSKSFPVRNRFSDVDITSDIDQIRINGLKFHSGGCTIGLSGDIDNLTGFLSSPDGRENLHGRLRLEIDTLDIPRIARIYENGVALTKGIKETLRVPKPPVDKSDCKTLLIPRNLDITVDARANHLLYTDLDMTDITTTLSVKNGLARIGDLGMHTAFGRGVVDVVYSSADIDRLNLAFTADIADVNLVDFFDCYRNTLLKAMPYMSNFSGDLSAKAGGQISLFPSMYFNVPSMTAYMNFRSRNLTVHQNKFIRHIIRLMLIHTSNDIHIPNLKINAKVHDNLVVLEPFYFIFNRYTVNFSGINNLDGDMFYHIAVDKSPVPFPFGVNLKGSFSHPVVRLGGAKLKTRDTEKIASEIMEEKRINMIQNLKYGFMEFLKMAAKEDTTGNQDYIFPVLVDGK